MNTEALRHLDAVVQTLHDGAGTVQPWFMSDRQRWRRLISTVMGHPLIRGAQRPRDFPADPAGRRAVAGAVGIQQTALPYWTSSFAERTPVVLFGDWIFAYSLLVESDAVPGPAGSGFLHDATLLLLWQLLRSAACEADDGRCQQLLSAVGLPLRRGEKLSIPNAIRDRRRCPIDRSDPAYQAAYLAYLAAACTNDPSIEAGIRISRPQQERLERPLWLVNVKATGVQEYMERARSVWLARGASAWAAQSLALVRELLIERSEQVVERSDHRNNLLLLTDVDALLQFASFVEPNAPELCERLEHELCQALGPDCQTRFPALHGLLTQPGAPSLPGTAASCLPRMTVDVTQKISVRDLCARRKCLTESELATEKAIREADGRRCHLVPPPPSGEGPCEFVVGDLAIRDVADVPWLEPRPGQERIGWKGIIWSLAGSTNQMRQVQGLSAGLGVRPAAVAWLHRQWFMALHDTGRFVYLKVDGDGVGRALASMPGLRTFCAGLEIQDRIQAGLQEGVRRVVDCWRQSHPGEEISLLPVDVVYIGGDDVFCVVPESLIESFLLGFESAAAPKAIQSFTGALLAVQAGLGKPHGSKVPEVTSRLVPSLLKLVKARVRDRIDEESLRPLRESAHEYGFHLAAADHGRLIGSRLFLWDFSLQVD